MKKVYFLVNNNFHVTDMNQHLEGLAGYEVNFITIPHTLNDNLNIKGVQQVFEFESPFSRGFIRSIFRFDRVMQIHALIKESLHIHPDDVLLMYTEFEPLNQYIAKQFKDAGARVYVLDEGLGTYLTYSVFSDAALPLKNKLKLFWFRKVVGYHWMNVLYYDGLEFPQMQDSWIDAVLLYHPIKVARDIPSVVVKAEAINETVGLDDNKCVFINSDMYNFYVSWDDYKQEIIEIMKSLVEQFDTVYFKFHPRETSDEREKIKFFLEVVSDIFFIEDNSSIEGMMKSIKAKYAISYASTSLLSLMKLGVTPVYIFNCVKSCSELAVFKSLNTILQSLGVTPAESLEKISLNRFYRKETQNDKLKSLIDCITKRNENNK